MSHHGWLPDSLFHLGWREWWRRARPRIVTEEEGKAETAAEQVRCLQKENERLHRTIDYAIEQFAFLVRHAVMDYTWREQVRKIVEELEKIRRG